MLPLKSKHNIRVVALNRRDYVGSTLFTPEELKDAFGTDEKKHKDFLKARGLEIAKFLVWVIDELKIPPRTPKGSGGLALLGWSLGNITTIAFLSNLKSYPREILEKLRPYFSTFFIYGKKVQPSLLIRCPLLNLMIPECSYAIFGHPHPEGSYHPLQDPDIPQRLKGVSFGTWLSSYYSHPFYTFPPSDQVAARSLSSLELRTPKTHAKRPTNENISPRELLASIDLAPGTRSEHAFYGAIKPETLYAEFTEALLLEDASTSSEELLLPTIKVVDIYGTKSMWSVQYGVWQAEDDLAKWKAEGRRTRPFEFVKFDGGNHFVSHEIPAGICISADS